MTSTQALRDTPTVSPPSIETVPRGSIASAISGATVKLLREYTGRGPTKARTHISDDHVSVVLQDTLTLGERSLVDDGRSDLVLEARKAFQKTMGPQLIAAVELHTGRSVLAFLSDNHIDPDIAVESFVLAPLGSGPTDVARANAESP
jgi:uncharacterized protein YbcI